MLNNVDMYFFSPTGGVKAVGDLFCRSLAETVHEYDIAEKGELVNGESSVAVFALPVFGGRIPWFAAEKISHLDGNGKKAVILAVYGTRAYEDALLELKHVVEECGYSVIAASAPVARHSIVPQVGQNRPDERDAAELKDFAEKVEAEMQSYEKRELIVPGNVVYRERSIPLVTPISDENCVSCGKCVSVCPLDAICLDDGKVKTDVDACILCMACTVHCPKDVRHLAPAVQNKMKDKLSAFTDVYRENEFYF